LDSTVFAIQKNVFPKEKKVKPFFIKGQVIDPSGEGLPAAVVWIPDLEQSFETDLDGNFEIKGFFSKKEKVEFRYLGFQPRTVFISFLLSKKNPKVLLSQLSG